MDEESLKRNTDCVYFLASPLTCRKGINCEFRHCIAARFHPRDCRYWLAGNCLNANCSFRHPPLDGRPASVSASAPAPTKVASTPSISVTSLSIPANKSRAPCYFFSQGYCSKGDRCSFLHGPLLSTSTGAVVAQKPPKAPICKGVETNNKLTSVVETNDKPTSGPTGKKHGSQDVNPGAGMTPVHSLPPNVFIRAQETSCINSKAEREQNSESFRTSFSSKRQSTHASSIKVQNSPQLHDVKQTVEPILQQKQSRDKHQLAEARQQQSFSDEERTQNGTWRMGPVKEASPDESNNSVYGDDLPYLIANRHFPKRSYSCNDAYDFGLHAQESQPRFHNTPLSLEKDSYECFSMPYEYDNQHSFSNSRDSPPFYARRDRHRIKGDLRNRLGKRRNFFQDQVSDINGYTDRCLNMDDYPKVDKRSFDWAPRRSDQGSDHSPNYGFRLDIGEDNADPISSGSSPMRFTVNDCQRSKYFNSEGSSYGSRRARRYSKLDVSDLGAQHRLAQPGLESEIYVDECLQTEGADTLRSEIHSSSYSRYMERPFIKSGVLPASSSDEVDLRGSTSNDFEGPKPLSILLQQSRKVKECSGETFMEQAGFDREQCAKSMRNSSSQVCLEKANIAGRKRKQGDSFGSCVVPRIA